MKYVNISVALEDNEIFEQSVKEAMLGQARQIAREELDKELSKEIARITDAKIDEIKVLPYWSDITKRVTDALIKRFENEINISSSVINQLIEVKIGEYLDAKLGKELNLDNYIQAYLNNSIASLLLNNKV